MLLALLILILLLVGWLATMIGMPGNWLMAAVLCAYIYWGIGEHGAGFWSYGIVAVGLALLGEVIELVASAAGLAKGGSKRGAALAMLGSIIGSVIGVGLGLPIPVIGSLVGVVLCSALGAMFGAMVGEVWQGKSLGLSVTIGQAAFWGRLIGTGAKLICGSIILVTSVVLLTSSWSH